MVRRASSVPHLNNSGGSSADSVNARGRAPAGVAGAAGRGRRGNNAAGKATTPTQQRQSSGSSGSGSRVPRSRSLTNGMRRLSPQKVGSSGSGTGGSSRNTPYFLRARENE